MRSDFSPRTCRLSPRHEKSHEVVTVIRNFQIRQNDVLRQTRQVTQIVCLWAYLTTSHSPSAIPSNPTVKQQVPVPPSHTNGNLAVGVIPALHHRWTCVFVSSGLDTPRKRQSHNCSSRTDYSLTHYNRRQKTRCPKRTNQSVR